MKKICCFFILLILLKKGDAQTNIHDVLSHYFKFNPYIQEFSAFFNRLSKDTTLVDKIMQKRTRDLPFSFSGFYKKHQPFRFTPQLVSISLGDLPIDYSTINDTIKVVDTVLYYTISGLTPEGRQYREKVVKELEWFNKNFARYLGNAQYRYTGTKENMTGESYSCFLPDTIVAPLVAGWSQLEGTEQYTFSITFLFKVRLNRAGSPDPF